MVQPLVEDQVWAEALVALPEWQPAILPTVVVAPHPDDETLGAGALIRSLTACGADVTVIAATDGENCYDAPLEERREMARTREAEQRTALEYLGVPSSHIVRLRLVDSGLHRQEAELRAGLAEQISPGMQVFAPWKGDFHPDHEACARAAEHVAGAVGADLIWYFFWTWHRGSPELLRGESPVRFVPDASALRAKANALQAHVSQLHCERHEPILPERLLAPARWPFEVFLPA